MIIVRYNNSSTSLIYNKPRVKRRQNNEFLLKHVILYNFDSSKYVILYNKWIIDIYSIQR